ncbi:MAG: citramalate synthase [Bauldia sp.]|nr:citramalate synthase [Bauldia sp.]
MTRERLSLFDTTLRDGAQTPGIDFTLVDKELVAELLDAFGIDYVEGGYPGANPLDTEFFAARRTKRAKFTAFGRVKKAGASVSNDPGLRALLDAKADAICFVAKASDYQVRVALGIGREDNLESVRLSVEAAGALGREALVDCEHFFDGYKADPAYALAVAKTAYDAGARWIVLCDTNGGTMPEEVEAIVKEVARSVPGDHLGIHAHDDTGSAVANSLAAVRAGARQIQGTLNGIGERCGNADLVAIIPTLMLKPGYADRFETGITAEALAGITKLSRRFDEMLNRTPDRQAPYVGASAFATKAGIHASALAKDTQTYEHVAPEAVGNRRRVFVSGQAGRSNLVAELDRMGVPFDRAEPRIDSLLAELKRREAAGYAYESADASFELLARRLLGTVPAYFAVEGFHVTVERRHNARGKLVSVSEAVVKMTIGGRRFHNVAEGNGPVNALDRAIRKDLGAYQADIADLDLVDYKVRILNGGTEAITRVLIESVDGAGNRWSTIGVSENVIDASFDALIDAIVFKLMKAGVTPVEAPVEAVEA